MLFNTNSVYIPVILGNAYLSLFFAAGQNSKVLKLCMSAYQQAVSVPVIGSNCYKQTNKLY